MVPNAPASYLFQGRKSLLTTKHRKEKVIGPLVYVQLGLEVETNHQFDTDLLGTFSGEVERKKSAHETVLEKCKAGLINGDYDLGMASEGSFGPHPSIPFVPCNEELVCLIDLKNNWNLVGKSLSFETNFHGEWINNIAELEEFATRVLFPSHAIILRTKKNEVIDVVKGIQNKSNLINHFKRLKQTNGKVWAESDMRAHLNPTRMKNIALATQNLIDKINSLCPSCQTPGFSVKSIQKGLPCELCQWPSESAISHLYECQACGHSHTLLFPNGQKFIDPMYCQLCNP